MDLRIGFTGLLCFLLIYFSTATFFVHCEARSSRQSQNSLGFQDWKYPHRSLQLEVSKRLDIYSPSDPNYVGSPDSLPPFGDAMGPTSSPDQNPPYCVYPPLTPLPPSTPLPTPIAPIQPSPPSPPLPPPPPPPPISTAPPVLTPIPPGYPTPPSPPEAAPSPPELVPSPPTYIPGPPSGIVPSPPAYGPSPPIYVPYPPPGIVPSPPGVIPSPTPVVPSPTPVVPSPPGVVPSPPGVVPSPPGVVPSPPGFAPGPPIFLPPVVYPPPLAPPQAPGGPSRGLWCVAKPTVPEPIIQEAMNYACGSGADCDSIQPNGSCYQPDTLIAHASFAFNSYWQRTKGTGGTCDFGGTAMLVTKDPSYDGCRFIAY